MPKESSENYRLLDFGDARKLEQFGSVSLDRPCPAADGTKPASPALWREADLTLTTPTNAFPRFTKPWRVSFPLSKNDPAVSLLFQLKLTPFGHVGVFPEQLQQWSWLHHTAIQLSGRVVGNRSEKLKALNLFAYTGGSTMALALGGAAVVHVDASAPAVAWARSNAQLNNLENHPIRWIVEDARKFVQREIKRSNHYDIVVLDPPSYGHGPTGKAWDLAAEWEELLTDCLQLLNKSQPALILWSGHSESPAADEIVEFIKHNRRWQTEYGRSSLTDNIGRTLDAGYYVRAISL